MSTRDIAIEELLGDASRSKTLIMEHSVARLRALVIAFNVLAWFAALGPGSPREPLAWSVIIIAVPYAIWSVWGRPYERYPLLRFGVATLVSDAILITVWVLATGGPDSPFWAITIVSIISVAMRYDLWQTIFAATGEALLMLGVIMFDGGADPLTVLVRPVYIVLAGLAAGLLARQERIQREESIAFEHLADQHARLLERERETVESLRQLDHMKNEFIAHAAHELRTPLTTLAGLASMLSTRHSDMSAQQLQGALESMGRQGERTKHLIENLLDLSQLDHGAMALNLGPVSISSSVQEAMQVAPPPPGHDVAVDLHGDVPVLADRRRLNQVLTNLLTNAYHYGGPHIRCTSDVEDDGVVLSIVDDGTGVPHALRPRLFQPFGRGDNIGEHVGSGLGLAICQRLVSAFGGEIWYEDEHPGARFTVRLPRAS